MTDHVFVGPSLPAAEAARLLPGARIHPPIAHGDLIRLDPGPGDRVLIVDGLFLQTAPVRHREILHALDRGVMVAGSSSMGALRAAELWPFGMRGVGEIFAMYRDQEITGDDEVAIVHGPAEDGSRALSEPLVNIRLALRAAVAAGAVTEAEAQDLVEVVRRLPFRLRGYPAMRHHARGAAAGFLAWLAAHPMDAKTADARLLLRTAATDPPALRPRDGSELPIENVRTSYFTGWQARFGRTEVDGRPVTHFAATTALMLLHPDFPAQHRRTVLARLTGTGPDDPELAEQAVAVARANGLLGADLPEPSWLSPAERALDDREAVLRVMVRAFGTVENRCVDDRLVPASLARPPVLEAAAALVAVAATLNDRLPPAAGSRRMRYTDQAIDHWFARLWGCSTEDLEPAVWDRGFVDLFEFRIAAEHFVAYLKVFGRPDLPPARPAGAVTAGN